MAVVGHCHIEIAEARRATTRLEKESNTYKREGQAARQTTIQTDRRTGRYCQNTDRHIGMATGGRLLALVHRAAYVASWELSNVCV